MDPPAAVASHQPLMTTYRGDRQCCSTSHQAAYGGSQKFPSPSRSTNRELIASDGRSSPSCTTRAAADTAELLRRLLGDAATQGVTKLDAPHPANSKDAVLRRTGDYDAAPPNRGARAGSRSPFTFIERPIEHEKTHKSLPKSPSKNALDHWLADARTCIELRCPGLHHKVDGLRVDREQMADEFLADWKTHHGEGENVSANAALGAAFVLLPKVTAAADAASWLSTWESQLVSSTRCAPTPRTDGSPTDACPDCRADRSCPGDTWPTLAAILVLGAGRNFNRVNSLTWLATDGRLADLVKRAEGSDRRTP